MGAILYGCNTDVTVLFIVYGPVWFVDINKLYFMLQKNAHINPIFFNKISSAIGLSILALKILKFCRKKN